MNIYQKKFLKILETIQRIDYFTCVYLSKFQYYSKHTNKLNHIKMNCNIKLKMFIVIEYKQTKVDNPFIVMHTSRLILRNTYMISS